ncbi:outer membrane protein assembly factor BamA [Candidatus Desantisbacteria bacterium CG_4_8_14_3_um_filter_40_12]|uniref:Outer membrane protein assembly factor BamA n=2 Tax=unclassified Candidatus Desantisiibacteriota TaxID=3106372 RepID=A0A2M7JEK9_9BACT|nr:MAG: outer membrane protein assembly factor BamA [Candidatus Desantisbacteria bacterium CG23_combo_of_CG06-09_8_20_14_all_40_23]PIX17832.1 MAG: outer membrane protein assembly factor BamA [Candidatus Desantisbacteria bacterium CG_4_8_14_3_um_filter_40_12]
MIQRMLIIAVCFLFYATNLYAQNEKAPLATKIITAITIVGNETVHEGIVLRAVSIKLGDSLDAKKVDADIRAIYKLGYFENVTASTEIIDAKVTLIFSVKERPMVGSITVTGSKEPSHEEIKKEITMKENTPYQQYQAKESVQKMLEYCQKQGYCYAEITHEVKSHSEKNKKVVDIVFHLDSKQLIKVKEITFLNSTIPVRTLKRQIKTAKGGIYNKSELEIDSQRLVYYYKSKGYIQAIVSSPEVVYSKEKKGMIITIDIFEGNQFKVTGVEIKGNKLISEAEIRMKMKTAENALYNIIQISQDMQMINSLYASKGYISCQIIPEEEVDAETKTVFISFKIDEGSQAYIEKILITGNTKTKNNVIRRELLIKDGSLFDGQDVRLSRQRLINLGYFEEVNFNIKPGTDEGKKILEIDVKEGKTGTFLFSAGYGSQPGGFGSIECVLNNLKGKGYAMNLKGELGENITNYEFGFTNPWFRDIKPKTLVGIESWHTSDKYTDYTSLRKGVALRTSRDTSKHNSLSCKYKYEEVSMRNMSANVSDSINDWKNKWGEKYVKTSGLNLRFIRNTKMGEDIFNPNSGCFWDISSDLVGSILGGDIEYFKPTIDVTYYIPSWWKFVLAVHSRFGIITKLNGEDAPPDYEKFRVGGHYSVRGYEERSICPQDNNKNPEGGEAVFVGNLEYRFPIAPKQLYGVLFADCGNVWKNTSGVDFSGLKAGAGIGLRINSPIGPIRMDYAWRLNDVPGQVKGETKIHFGIGPSF